MVLGIDIYESVPNYSTWSKNYTRRYKDREIFNQIFQHIIRQGIDNGFIDTTTVFDDETHRKACANIRKATDKEVKIVSKIYEKALLDEINEQREADGKKPFASINKKEYVFNEETEVDKTKHIKESTTDPKCGIFHKGEKQKCFAYMHMTMCDTHGYVLYNKVSPGIMHDSTIFSQIYIDLINMYTNIKNLCLDAGFDTSAICHQIMSSERKPFLPYKRPMTKKV